ncbi:MAG: CAAX protease family protein [Bacteroidetes bacterium MedPE-SWsnd-G2]|nr:MAG: CAAX protease family protein [Bacteroidetes bacterium MedPE-SWsnd-G2]
MYIEQAYKSLHEFWRYVIGVIISIIGVGVFSMPHAIAIAMKSLSGGVDESQLEDLSYIMNLFDSNLNLVFMLLPFLGGLLFLLFSTKVIHQQTFTALTTAREKVDWGRVFFAFAFWGIVSSTLIAIGYFMEPETFELNFQLEPFLILCVIALLLIPIQTSFEEYLFRGYLMQGIGVLVKNKWFPLVITSVVFGLMHLANPEVEQLGPVIMVYYIGTGLFLAIITLMDEGLELALGFHAANNLFTALLVTADWTAFQTYSVFKDTSSPTEAGFFDIFMPVFVIFPLLILIFAKKYKWNNWKDKLFGKVEPPLPDDYKILD